VSHTYYTEGAWSFQQVSRLIFLPWPLPMSGANRTHWVRVFQLLVRFWLWRCC